MKWHAGFVFLSTILLNPAPGTADDFSRLYSQTALSRAKPRYERRVKEMYAKGIWPSLSQKERQILRRVEFQFPLPGKDNHPMNFYTYTQGGKSFVALPVLSLMFLEDLSTAYAWLWANRFSLETIDEYATMLKYKKPADFRGKRYPPPLQALQIPENALSDPKVDELSLRFRNTAYAFILLHELGHALYGHRGYQGISMEQARRNEENADRFAFDVLKRTSTIPMGAVLFFQAQAYLMPNRGQYKTQKEWEAFLKSKGTHPLTSRRIRAIALQMDQAASGARQAPAQDTLRYISTRLVNIGKTLEDPDLQRCMAVVAHRADPSSLAPRRRGKTKAHLERLCGKKG